MGNLLKMTMQIMGKSFGNLWKFGIFSMAMSSYQTKLREQKTKLGDKAAAAGKAGDHEGRQVLGVNQDPLNIKGRTPIGLIVNVILGKMSEIKEPARKL